MNEVAERCKYVWHHQSQKNKVVTSSPWLLFTWYLPSPTSVNLFSINFKIYPKSKHFPSSLRLWSKTSSFLTWIITMASHLFLLLSIKYPFSTLQLETLKYKSYHVTLLPKLGSSIPLHLEKIQTPKYILWGLTRNSPFLPLLSTSPTSSLLCLVTQASLLFFK